MATLDEINHHLNELLDCNAFSDYCPNGIQVRGRERINKIVTGVSACTALFAEALREKADLIIVHHGLFWDGLSPLVEGHHKQRLKMLLDTDLSLMAYHLPLDAHPELGNNAQILERLGLDKGEAFGRLHGKTLSFMGVSNPSIPFSTLAKGTRDLFGGEPLMLPFGPEYVTKIAVCSGNAPELLREAKQKGAELYITGEATEWVYHYAREESISYIAAGHHRTERFGLMALGSALADKFAIRHQFIDIANPI